MYRITHTPTGEVIAIASTWQDASATLRTHSDALHDDVYNAVTADPSIVLHLYSIGDNAYTITRDEGDLRICDNCGDSIGIVTSQSDNHPHGRGSWSIACCADCATEWETTYPDEPSDYRADYIRRIVTARTRIDGLRHTATATADTCATCGMDMWDCAAHHGDTHYHH